MKAAQFDGQANPTGLGDQFYAEGTPLRVASATALQAPASNGQFSIYTWVRLETLPQYGSILNAIVSKYGSTSTEYMLFRANGPDKFAWLVGGAEIDGATTPALNTWYFLVGTFDGTNIHLWVDGAEDATPAAATSIQGSEDFRIGGASNGSQWRTNGRIACAGKFDFALNGGDVAWLYNAASGRTSAEVLAHSWTSAPKCLYSFENPGNLGLDGGSGGFNLAPAFSTGPAQAVGPDPTTATLSGPTTGTAGSPSGNFTVALNEADDAGTRVFTLVDSTGGNTFAGTGVSGTTLTIPSGTPSRTFTYTRASAGTSSISITGGGGLAVAGSPIAYVASAAGPTSATLASTPTTATVGVETASIGITLDAPAIGGGQLVNLASTGSGDLFHAASGGATLSGVTIGAGQTFGAAKLVAGSAGSRNVSITASGLAIAGSPLAIAASNPVGTATTFALTGPSTGFVSNASGNFTFTPDSNYTGTLAPAMTGLAGAWSPTSLTWSGDGASKSSAFTPSAVGPGNANATGSPSLTPPASVAYASTARTLSASPSTLAPSTTITVTFTGGGTKWSTTAPTFAASGVSGVSIGSVTVVSNTSATAPVTTGTSSGTITFTDSTTTATATVSASGNLTVLTAVVGLAAGLTTVGYRVSSGGGSFGSRVTTGITEDVAGTYSAFASAPSGSLVKIKWDDGAGAEALDANPQGVSGPGGGGGSGVDPWTVPLPGDYPPGSAGYLAGTSFSPDVASNITANSFALGPYDALRGTNVAGSFAYVYHATTGGGQWVKILASNTTTNTQTVAGWANGVTPTGPMICYAIQAPSPDKDGYRIDLNQPLVSSIGPTVGGALTGAWAVAFGKTVKDVVNKVLTIFGFASNTVPLKTFALDDGKNPTSRTP